MRIKRVESDQFAGIIGKELEFEKGLNIIIGDNETGKSTMVDLIYLLLFKDIRLDGRSDVDFIDRYFPKKSGEFSGDAIEGTLVFETDDGKYKLHKEWERGEGSCKLILPDGTMIKSNAEINKILAGVLKYRAGVYSEMVFASQKRNQLAIESIMKALGKKDDRLKDTRADLTSTLTKAALETGGVSLEKLESSLMANIDNLIGRWDMDADAPEGGPKRAGYKNAWSNGAGEIVKAYYAVDEIMSKQQEAENAERAVCMEKAKLKDLQEKKKLLEAKKYDFQKSRGMLEQKSLLTKTVNDLEIRINEMNTAMVRWPKLSEDLSKVKSLKEKRTQAAIRDLYLKAEMVHSEYAKETKKLAKLKPVDADDLKSLREMLIKKQKEESKLAGINLVAKIRQMGPDTISVKALASGQEIPTDGGNVLITEAVDISIPGVMEMQLMPQGVDIDAVKEEVKKLDCETAAIYKRYGTDSLELLQTMADDYADAKQRIERFKLELEKILGDKSWEELEALKETVPADTETEAEIKKHIEALCKAKSVDEFIGGTASVLATYAEKYESLDGLGIAIANSKKELKLSKEKLASFDDIPEEFRGIDDADSYDALMQSELDGFEADIKEHEEKLREADRKTGEISAEEYTEELLEKKAFLEAKKTELKHWINIYKVFTSLKEQTQGNPILDIEEKFERYLSVITDGRIKLSSMDETLSVNISSGTNLLSYETLSDGTKDTVSLAFRLAMLEHLYPDGDGLAVFDDPFTDMDPKRVEESCKLIQKFAEKNQVIFITCDDKYKKLLDGNEIVV